MMSAFDNRIVCVRHGETVWKCEGRSQGQLDSPLTDVGISQVRRLAEKLERDELAAILSSSLGRTMQTAEILSGQLGISDLRWSDDLIERHEGAFQGLTQQQQAERYPDAFDKDTGMVKPAEIPGAERIEDFLARVARGLKAVRSLAETGGVLVVTHAGVMRAIRSLVFGEDFLESRGKSVKFCDILRLESPEVDES